MVAKGYRCERKNLAILAQVVVVLARIREEISSQDLTSRGCRKVRPVVYSDSDYAKMVQAWWT